jgi:hypothetical protein
MTLGDRYAVVLPVQVHICALKASGTSQGHMQLFCGYIWSMRACLHLRKRSNAIEYADGTWLSKHGQRVAGGHQTESGQLLLLPRNCRLRRQ